MFIFFKEATIKQTFFLLCCVITSLQFSCKKDEIPQKKGAIYFENNNYPLHSASRNSVLAFQISDSNGTKLFYRHDFSLKSSDNKNQAIINIISDDTTLTSGAYFLKTLSAKKVNGNLVLNVLLNKYIDESSLLRIKSTVLFQNERLLKINFLYDENQIDINWDGQF